MSGHIIEYPADGKHITEWDGFVQQCKNTRLPTDLPALVGTAVSNNLHKTFSSIFLPMIFHGVGGGMLAESRTIFPRTTSPTMFLVSDTFKKHLATAGFNNQFDHRPSRLMGVYASKMPDAITTVVALKGVAANWLGKKENNEDEMTNLTELVMELEEVRVRLQTPAPSAGPLVTLPRHLMRMPTPGGSVTTIEDLRKMPMYNLMVQALKQDLRVDQIEAKQTVLESKIDDVEKSQAQLVETAAQSIEKKVDQKMNDFFAKMTGFVSSLTGGGGGGAAGSAPSIDQAKIDYAARFQAGRSIDAKDKSELTKMTKDSSKSLKDMEEFVKGAIKKKRDNTVLSRLQNNVGSNKKPRTDTTKNPSTPPVAGGAPDSAPPPPALPLPQPQPPQPQPSQPQPSPRPPSPRPSSPTQVQTSVTAQTAGASDAMGIAGLVNPGTGGDVSMTEDETNKATPVKGAKLINGKYDALDKDQQDRLGDGFVKVRNEDDDTIEVPCWDTFVPDEFFKSSA